MLRITAVLLSGIVLSGCGLESENLALGTLERDRVAHTAVANEVVVALPIAQGDVVNQGDILVQLKDDLQRAKVAKAEADVARAQANLDKLTKGARDEDIAAAKAIVAGAKASALESEANYRRQRNLVKKKLASQADLDRALAARDSAVATLHSSQENLNALIKGTREEDLRIAQADLDATIAVLSGEQQHLQDLTVRASRDGVLDNLPWNLGERVTQGSPVAIVLAGASPYARVYIPEPYRVHVKIGDTLVVRVDGLEQTIDGEVRWLSNEPAFSPYYALNQQERARLMYLAEIQLPNQYASLPSGVPAQVVLP